MGGYHSRVSRLLRTFDAPAGPVHVTVARHCRGLPFQLPAQRGRGRRLEANAAEADSLFMCRAGHRLNKPGGHGPPAVPAGRARNTPWESWVSLASRGHIMTFRAILSLLHVGGVLVRPDALQRQTIESYTYRM